MRLKHIPYLDGWRGLAILLVFIGHFFDLPGSRLGVEVFFALSGMLMSRILYDEKLSLRNFYQNRFARIIPIYYIYLATIALFSLAILPTVAWEHLVFSALFLVSYMPFEISRSLLPLTHLWSLSVEEHSYIYLSLVAFFTRDLRIVRAILTATAVVCIVFYTVYYYFPVDRSNGIFRTECAALPLVASAALHLWLKKSSASIRITLFYTSCLGLMASIILSRKFGGNIFIDYIAKPLIIVTILNTLQQAPNYALNGLQASWLRWLGVLSFSLYIWHPAVLEFSTFFSFSRWVALLLALIVGSISFYLIENPLRSVLSRHGHKTYHAASVIK